MLEENNQKSNEAEFREKLNAFHQNAKIEKQVQEERFRKLEEKFLQSKEEMETSVDILVEEIKKKFFDKLA